MLSRRALIPLSFLILIFVSAASPAAQGSDDWPMFHHDARRTGYTAATGRISNPMLLWAYHLSGYSLTASPIAADVDGDGQIEVVATDKYGNVYSIGGSSGALEWKRQPVSGSIMITPAAADVDGDGHVEVIVGGSDNKVYCLDGSTGTTEWSFTAGDDITTSPVVADVDGDGQMEVIVGAKNGALYCLSGSDGTQEWSAGVGWSLYSSPAVADLYGDGRMKILIGSGDNKLHCLNADGTVNWTYTTGDDIAVTPAVADLYGDGRMKVVFGSYDGKVYCLNADGTVNWTYNTYWQIRSSPAVADVDGDGQLEVLIGSNNHKLYCFESDGTRKWTYTVHMNLPGDTLQSSPAVADVDGDGQLEVLIGSTDHNLYCVDGSTGSQEWYYTAGGTVDPCSPAVADVDGDGQAEIVLSDGSYHVRALDQGYTLSVEVRDDSGSSIACQVNLNPPDSDYGDGDTRNYLGGTSVTATAKTCSGYRFDHWELDGSDVGSNNSYTFTMDDNHTLRAVYVRQYVLTVEVRDGSGASLSCQVNLNPPDANLSDGGTQVYDHDTSVTATALSCTGYRFDHWELDGSNVGSSNPYSLTMDSDHTLRAVYVKQYVLTVEVRDDSGGSIGCQVNLNPPNSDYGDGDSQVYDHGTSVQATAKTCSGYRFDHWELDGSNVGSSNPCSLNMDSDHTLRAVYRRKRKASFSVSPGAPTPAGDLSSLGFPSSFRYVALGPDRFLNPDLLSPLAGPAQPGYSGPLLILGGPAVSPYDWSSVGVEFLRFDGVYSAVRVRGVTYRAEYGSRDYCVLSFNPSNLTVRVAGITRYGTRAGLMWLLDHPDAFANGNNVLLYWRDLDGDGSVDPGEIRVLATW